jgi:HK97 family phage prohead protease
MEYMHTTAFTYGGKSFSNVYELSDGDLIIEGVAANWDKDRENESFAPGAFQRGIKAFLDGSATLAFHHKHEKVLGKVLSLEEMPGGLKMRARVDGAIKNHPELGVIYEQIKRGTLNSLSCGGFFQRLGNKIVNVDITELSVTPVAVGHRTNFAVVAGKALQARSEALEVIESELAMIELRATILSVKQLTL